MSRNVLKKLGLIRVAFVAVVGLPFIIAPGANAQNPAASPAAGAAPAGAQAEAERVIVTGSNIPTAEEVGPNPVLNLNRDLINKSGERNLESLLRNQSVINGNGIVSQNNGTSQQGPDGTTAISLRGFDVSATLVLVDGRRVASYPQTSNGNSSFVDINTIPLSAVESIEILKDGASATYGADAVSGVVNIKLYKDYRGAQLTLDYGNTLDKDAGLYSGDLLFGTGDDKMSVTGDIFYYHHNSMFNRDRGNSLIPPFLSTNTIPWNFNVSRASVLPALGLMADPIPNLNPTNNPGFFTTDANGNPILNAAGLALVGHTAGDFTNRNDATIAGIPKFPGGTVLVRKLVGVDGQGPGGTAPFLGFTVNNLFFQSPPNGTNGLSPANTSVFNNGQVRGPRAAGTVLPGFNFNLFSANYPEIERWGGYAAFNDKICDDQVQLYGDFYYDQNKVHDELAPLATNNFQTKTQFTIFVPPTAPFANDTSGAVGGPPAGTPTAAGVGAPVGAFNPFNPFQQFLSGGSRARFLDFGNRLEDIRAEAWVVTLGVKGDKLFDGSWGYDAGFRYSEIDTTSRFQGINGPKFEEVLNANSSIFQPGSSDFIGTTVPYNPFGSGTIPGNAKLVDFARAHTHDLFTSKLTSLDTNIYTTDLFDLPAGGVGLAFGGGWRREVNTSDPDDQDKMPVQALGVSFITPFHIGRDDYDFYVESRIPLFSPEMGIWGLHSMEFSAAGRFEDFRNNDSNVLVPKVELRWQPFDEQLTFRTTWGEGFLEPSLPQLNGGPAFSLSATNFKGVPENETTTEFDPNPQLQPERSRTWTGGFVYTPKWVENLVPNLTATASIDLWDIERKGVVITPTAQQVVARFARGALLPGEEVDLDPTGTFVSFVKSNFQNAGRENGRGADFSLQFQYQTPNWGTFTWYTQASYLDSFIFQSSGFTRGREVSGRANEDPFDGTFFGAATGGDGWLKWKGNSRIDWTWHNFDLNWTVHYLDGFKEIIAYVTNPDGTPGAHEHYVHGTFFFDCQASYTLIFTAPVESQPVAGYSKGGKEVMTGKDGKEIESAAAYSMPCWKTLLNNSTFTIGCNDVFGQDPPKMFGFQLGNATNYPPNIYDNIGRFVYFELKKKF